MLEISNESKVIDAQVEVFAKIFYETQSKVNHKAVILKAQWIDTILGSMLAISDDSHLYLLEFIHRRGLQKEIEKLRSRGYVITLGDSLPIDTIKSELTSYFKGQLTNFTTPYKILGSDFQQQVWKILCKIPYGETRSYKAQAISLNKPNSYRAVANANGANQLAIIIPCHRIIASDGTLGGYGGGIAVKQWLLDHEKLFSGYVGCDYK